LRQSPYSVTPSEIVAPSWLDEKFYDIVAKVPDGAPAEQTPEMLQNLLALRFGMRVLRPLKWRFLLQS